MAIKDETDWLICDDPHSLGKYCTGRVNVQRFRWLVVEWGQRIRHKLSEVDLSWFNAFENWIHGRGDEPKLICSPPVTVEDLHPDWDLTIRYSRSNDSYYESWIFGDRIRSDNPMLASIIAAYGASEDFPPLEGTDDQIDFSKAHKRKSKKDKAMQQEIRQQEYARLKAWSNRKKVFEEDVLSEFCEQFRDVAGNPFRPVSLNPRWQTDNVTRLAQTIDETGQYHLMPILADALLEADCDSAEVLKHCREEKVHVRGCWLIDLLLGRM